MDALNNGERQVAPTLEGIRRDHVARYEWAARQLRDCLTVFDVACGVGYGAHVLGEAGLWVCALDKDPDALQYARDHYGHSKVLFQRADASDPTLSLSPRDAAVCFETIEHIEDPLPLLKALCRAAPVLVASVPNEAVFPHGGRVLHHHRHYTKGQFLELLQQSGYVVVGWYGQRGPTSEVEADIEGRTLIAFALRAEARPAEVPPKIAQGVVPAASLKVAPLDQVPEHVAIVGLGPTCVDFFELTRRLGGVSAWCDEVWGINAIGDVLRCDRIFHMDDVRIQEARAAAKPEDNIAAMVQWLKTHPGPIYTSVVREGYPGLVAFPLQDVLNGGYDTNGGAPYFTSTAAYAIAFAVHIGVKKISLFGLDFTLPNSHQAEKGRACCEFWLGIAGARGIEIVLPDRTSLLGACEGDEGRLYGYDCVDVTLHDRKEGGVEVRMKAKDVVPSAEEIEQRYSRKNHPNPMMN